MSDYKENWRNYTPPLVPIYYIEYDALKILLEKNETNISREGLELMLGYFEEFECFEKAALVRDFMNKSKIFKPTVENSEPDFPPPDDGKDWNWDSNTKMWIRQADEEEVKRFFRQNNDNDIRDRNDDNPYRRENPFK